MTIYNFIQAAKKLNIRKMHKSFEYITIQPDKLQFTDIETLITFPVDSGLSEKRYIKRDGLAKLVTKTSKISFEGETLIIDGLALPLEKGVETAWSESTFTGNPLETFEITASDLKQVSFAIGEEETRHYLCGVYFDKGALVATNGHQLAKLAVKPFNSNFILPSDAVKILESGSNWQITYNDNKTITFSGNGLVIHSKEIDGTFPDYNRVIPQVNEGFFSATFNRKELQEACKKAKKLGADKVKTIILNGEKVTSEGIELGKGCGIPDFNAKFNAEYLLNIAELMNSDAITLQTEKQFCTYRNCLTAPFLCSEGNLLTVTMPMRA